MGIPFPQLFARQSAILDTDAAGGVTLEIRFFQPLKLAILLAGAAIAACHSPLWAGQHRFDAPAADRVRSVSQHLQVEGVLKANAGGAGVSKLPLKVSADLNYSQKGLSTDADLAELRKYDAAAARIEVGKMKFDPKLDGKRSLITAVWDGERQTLASPQGPLSREELDLINVQGSPLLLAKLLPRGAVDVGDKWRLGDDLLAALLTLEAVGGNEASVSLKSVRDGVATLEIEGAVAGAVDGVATKIDLQGELRYRLADKEIERFRLQVKEDRDIGHAQPGLEVTARIDIRIEPATAEQSERLAGELLAKAELHAANPNLLLAFESPRGGFRMIHDRRWRTMREGHDLTIMRLVDRGDLVAQCNVAPLKPTDDGEPLSMKAFQEDIRKALGDKLASFTKAQERLLDSDLRLLRVEASGVVRGIDIVWIYGHLDDRQGRRASVVFTMESELVEKFRAADEAIWESFQFVETDEAKTAKQPAAATKR